MRIAFRRWGKMEARGRSGLLTAVSSATVRLTSDLIGKIIHARGLPYGVMRRLTRRVDLARNEIADKLARPLAPDAFLLEAFNPTAETYRLLLTLRPEQPGLYQRTLTLSPGYNRLTVPSDSWRDQIDCTKPMLVQIEPQEPIGSPITFGIVDFVRFKRDTRVIERALPRKPSAETDAASHQPADGERPKVKCVVWDLDNTVWSGTLVEDGAENLKLNAKAAAAIVELDRRGILNSIASKNSAEDAEAVLKRFGLFDYFLFPQISWSPKSAAIPSIARQLNISEDTFLLVDDQAFERSEVEYAHPTVETFDANDLDELLNHPRLNVIISGESQRRRLMYLEEQTRIDAMAGSGLSDIADFLRECNIRLELTDLGPENIDRAFELTERTNQLNYSGQRLSRAMLKALSDGGDRRGVVLSASDRFGDYGIIGFASICTDPWEVDNFFMSCRVQRKKVDHAFFQHLLFIGREASKRELRIRYVPTAKNSPSREVLEVDMGLGARAEGPCVFYLLETSAVVPNGDLVRVEDLSSLRQLTDTIGAGVAG
jgi:FkbH-like protein